MKGNNTQPMAVCCVKNAPTNAPMSGSIVWLRSELLQPQDIVTPQAEAISFQFLLPLNSPVNTLPTPLSYLGQRSFLPLPPFHDDSFWFPVGRQQRWLRSSRRKCRLPVVNVRWHWYVLTRFYPVPPSCIRGSLGPVHAFLARHLLPFLSLTFRVSKFFMFCFWQLRQSRSVRFCYLWKQPSCIITVIEQRIKLHCLSIDQSNVAQ